MTNILAKLAIAIPLTFRFHYKRLLESLKRPIEPSEPSETRMVSTPPPQALDNTSDIFHTAAILRHLPIPPDLIPSILDFAEYYYRITAASSNLIQYITRWESGTIYLAAGLPRNIAPTSLRRIVFTTTSHDQGYNMDHNNYKTYNGSWTGFGVAVLDHERPEDFKSRVEGKPIINLLAEKQFITHAVVWNQNDEDPDIQDAFRALMTGKLIALTACAAYPESINFVGSASIEFDVQPVRKM